MEKDNNVNDYPMQPFEKSNDELIGSFFPLPIEQSVPCPRFVLVLSRNFYRRSNQLKLSLSVFSKLEKEGMAQVKAVCVRVGHGVCED